MRKIFKDLYSIMLILKAFDKSRKIISGNDYKKNMFALLGKPGFEELAKELNERL